MFAWLEEEQATMNQQVRMGGGLLKGRRNWCCKSHGTKWNDRYKKRWEVAIDEVIN